MNNFSFKKINDQTQLIISGEKYPDGTAIEIYLKKFKDEIILTDLGFTTLWLLNLGFKITDSEERISFIESNKNINNFSFYGGEIIIKIDDLKFLNKDIQIIIELCNNFISYFTKDKNDN